jgi:hypothetical protein
MASNSLSSRALTVINGSEPAFSVVELKVLVGEVQFTEDDHDYLRCSNPPTQPHSSLACKIQFLLSALLPRPITRFGDGLTLQ